MEMNVGRDGVDATSHMRTVQQVRLYSVSTGLSSHANALTLTRTPTRYART